jgi:DNA-binding transcriptional ArsR family regulator
MPRTRETTTASALKVEFVASVPLDLVNAMYFTSLAGQAEGIDDWPAQVRREMRPDLLEELDFLFAYPLGEPGLMCALNDLLFAHRETWTDLEALLAFVREMPSGVGGPPKRLGIQGLVNDVLRWWESHRTGIQVDHTVPPRERLAKAVADAGRDVDAVLAVYDRPEELRERILTLIQRFYDDHYRHDLARRLPCLERSVAAHRNQPLGDIDELIRSLTPRPISCVADNPGVYTQHIFAPSLDMGPYMSCADTPPIHGLYYPCEARFIGPDAEESEESVRLARIHKALSDEQRLRILRLLRNEELYAHQIVERTGLHQSVVSRHLEFMKVVGLVIARRQGNMKFFSLNRAIRDELGKTLDLFLPAAGTRGQRPF